MRNVISILMFVAAICSCMVITSFAAQTGDVTVFGVTLGKSFEQAGMQKCSGNGDDSNCYRENDYRTGKCFNLIRQNFSFVMDIYASLANDCDRQSPVQEVQAHFHSDFYEKVLSLVIGKFGKPHKTEKSIVQNRMGAKFRIIETEWNIRKHWIYLTNMHETVDEGFLRVIHPDKLHRDDQKYEKKERSDRDKF